MAKQSSDEGNKEMVCREAQ